MARLTNVRMRSMLLLVQFLSTCSSIEFKPDELSCASVKEMNDTTIGTCTCDEKSGKCTLSVTLEFGHVQIPENSTGLKGELHMLGFNVPFRTVTSREGGATCDLPPSPPALPPLAPPPEDTCTDEAKFTCKKSKCKKSKCKKYSDRKKQQCKKTCGLCETLPPSAPPPSLPPALRCAGLEDDNKCKIKNCADNAKALKKCEKLCKKKNLRKKCQKTCCDLSP